MLINMNLREIRLDYMGCNDSVAGSCEHDDVSFVSIKSRGLVS